MVVQFVPARLLGHSIAANVDHALQRWVNPRLLPTFFFMGKYRQ